MCCTNWRFTDVVTYFILYLVTFQNLRHVVRFVFFFVRKCISTFDIAYYRYVSKSLLQHAKLHTSWNSNRRNETARNKKRKHRNLRGNLWSWRRRRHDRPMMMSSSIRNVLARLEPWNPRRYMQPVLRPLWAWVAKAAAAVTTAIQCRDQAGWLLLLQLQGLDRVPHLNGITAPSRRFNP